MPITQELREDGWVVYYTLVAPWSVQELQDKLPQETAWRDAADHTTHELVDVNKVGNPPPESIRLHKIPALTHPRSGYVVVIGANTFVRRLAEVIFRLGHYKRLRFVDSEQEGWVFLRGLIADEKAKVSGSQTMDTDS